MTPLSLLSRAEDAALAIASPVIFAVVDAVEAVPRLFGWREMAEWEQRKGVGERREKHLENASRLREIGWPEMVEQRRQGAGDGETRPGRAGPR